MRRLIAVVACLGVLSLIACGKSSPTTPTPPPAATATRIITVSGDLAFGNVDLGASADRTFTIGNSGNATLTYTSISGVGFTSTAGITASPTTGTVAPGATQTVTVRFAPTVAQYYTTVVTIASDRTSGGNGINFSGTGVNNRPLFTRSGTGDTVFDMPTTVARVRITGDYGGSGSNFIVHIGNDYVVNEIIGTRWPSTHFEGTYLTTGGVVSITSSSGVSWSFTEVR